MPNLHQGKVYKSSRRKGVGGMEAMERNRRKLAKENVNRSKTRQQKISTQT
jgi:hypothetical protein